MPVNLKCILSRRPANGPHKQALPDMDHSMDYSGAISPKQVSRVGRVTPFQDDESVFDRGVPATKQAPDTFPKEEVATRGGDLSDEEARKLFERREPGDVKCVLQVIDSPSQWLSWKSGVIEAQRVDYVRIHQGNLERRLALHRGGNDVPSGRKESSHGYDRSPFDINLKDYRLLLRKGKTIFQFLFYNWTHLDVEGDPSWGKGASRSRPTVEEAPEGWISIAKVSDLKDQNQSSITRGIARGDLDVVMQESPRKRFIKAGPELEKWSPGRQQNFLLRRRLKLLQTVIRRQLDWPKTARTMKTGPLMELVKREEIREYGRENVPEGPYQAFFEDQLGDDCPQTAKEWVLNLPELIGEHCR